MNENAKERTLNNAVQAVRAVTNFSPRIALILGSGLGALADAAEDAVAVPTVSIPGYPASTVPGHSGRLVLGRFAGENVVFVQGRVHLYEGYSRDEVTFPVRLVHGLGARLLVVTNAAGGISESCTPGTLMSITDHLDFSFSPPAPGRRVTASAGGEYEMEAGLRTLRCPEPYDLEWTTRARHLAQNQGVDTVEGTYLWTRGPSYETPAEIRMFADMGANAVGMSTVPEVMEANALNMRVVGISTITNYAAGISEDALDHDDVLEVGRRVQKDLKKLVSILIRTAPGR